MITPGNNLLRLALTAINPSKVEYLQFLENSNNGVGVLVPKYDEPLCIRGSIQPVPMNLYQTLNLDFTKTYFMLYTSTAIADIQRDATSDRIRFNDSLFQVVSKNDWSAIDGWNGVLLVKVPTT